MKSGGCDGDRQGTVWRYQGTAGTGTWQQVPNPGAGSFGVFAVDPGDPQRLIASHLGGATGPRMVMTRNGGTTWTPIPALDGLMTGAGVSRTTTRPVPGRSRTSKAIRSRRWSRSTRSDRDILVAGGADSGVFISTNGGTRWQLVTDPISPGTSGIPHIPRPYYAHFDHDAPGGDVQLYLGTRGRGAWRLTFAEGADARDSGTVAAGVHTRRVSATSSGAR